MACMVGDLQISAHENVQVDHCPFKITPKLLANQIYWHAHFSAIYLPPSTTCTESGKVHNRVIGTRVWGSGSTLGIRLRLALLGHTKYHTGAAA